MQEATKRIRKDLGSDAIIISTRRVRQKGIRGFFLPRLFEVTATVDKKENDNPLLKKTTSFDNSNNETDTDEIKALISQAINKHYETNESIGSDNNINNNHSLKRFYQKLIDSDVEQAIADKFLEEIDKNFSGQKLSENQLNSLFEDKINRYIKAMNFNGQKHVFCFVGPTGVGKTTTLAKLAAYYLVHQEKKVGLITIDNYRIGAVEQLKTYAQLMDIPIEAVMSPQGLREAVNKMDDMDIIMIDTAGRNSKNTFQVGELQSFLKVMPEPTVFLVLSVTTKSSDLANIVNNFQPTNYNALIFTKLDETSTYGNMLNVAYHTSLPVAFLATGQKVPEDLELPTEEQLANLILGDGS